MHTFVSKRNVSFLNAHSSSCKIPWVIRSRKADLHNTISTTSTYTTRFKVTHIYVHTFRKGFHERSRCWNDVTGSTCWSTIAPPVGFIGLVSHIITELQKKACIYCADCFNRELHNTSYPSMLQVINWLHICVVFEYIWNVFEQICKCTW